MLGYVGRSLRAVGKRSPVSPTLHDAVGASEAPLEKTMQFLNFHWVNEDREQLKTILTDGLSAIQFQTPLMVAIRRNRADLVKVLLQFYRLLNIKCTLGLVDSTHPRGKNALDYAIANYRNNGSDSAWEILRAIIDREHELCTAEDTSELPRIVAQHGDLADILAERNIEFDSVVGWVDVAPDAVGGSVDVAPDGVGGWVRVPRNGPSSAFEAGPFDFRKPALEGILYGLEELALGTSNADKQALVQTLIRRLHTLSPADKSAVRWLNEELVYLFYLLMVTTRT